MANSARLYAEAKRNLGAAVDELQREAEKLIPRIQTAEALRNHFKSVGNLGTKDGAAEFLKHLIALPI